MGPEKKRSSTDLFFASLGNRTRDIQRSRQVLYALATDADKMKAQIIHFIFIQLFNNQEWFQIGTTHLPYTEMVAIRVSLLDELGRSECSDKGFLTQDQVPLYHDSIPNILNKKIIKSQNQRIKF